MDAHGGQLDHAGNLAWAKAWCGAPIYAHPLEQAHIDGTYDYTGVNECCGRMERAGRTRFRNGKPARIDVPGADVLAAQDEAARSGRALPSIVSGTGVPRSRRIAAGIERGVLDARPMFERIEANGVRWSDGSQPRPAFGERTIPR